MNKKLNIVRSGNQEKQSKILILVDWFTPGYKAGGPIQSCVNAAYALKEEFNVKVLTTDTDYGATKPYVEIESNQWTNKLDPEISVYYARKETLTLNQIKRIILEVNADYIYLNHLFSPKFVVFPLWLKWKGELKNKIVVCPRGALYESALSIKKYKKAPYLRIFRWMGIHRLIRFHATNEREKIAILKYFPGSEIVIADNFPNMRQPEFRSIEKKPGIVKCIFISRIHPIKNLLFLLQLLAEVKATVELTIIGPIEDEPYWQKCKSVLNTMPPNISANYVGAVPNNQLIEILQKHHLFILPTSGENFGHAIFESLLAGRPVIISDQTPWQNLYNIKIGWDLPLHDQSGFVKAIEIAAGWDHDEFTNHAKSSWEYAKVFINTKGLNKQYFQLFHE